MAVQRPWFSLSNGDGKVSGLQPGGRKHPSVYPGGWQGGKHPQKIIWRSVAPHDFGPKKGKNRRCGQNGLNLFAVGRHVAHPAYAGPILDDRPQSGYPGNGWTSYG